MTKEEKQRLRKEKKQQRKGKEKKDDKTSQEGGKEKNSVSSSSAPQPSIPVTAQKGTEGSPSFYHFLFQFIFSPLFFGAFIDRHSLFLFLSAPSAVPASVPVPAPECAAPVDKPAKSKAELKAERRARQEAERAFKQAKKGEAGQQAVASKPKGQPSELQPGTASIPMSAKKKKPPFIHAWGNI